MKEKEARSEPKQDSRELVMIDGAEYELNSLFGPVKNFILRKRKEIKAKEKR